MRKRPTASKVDGGWCLDYRIGNRRYRKKFQRKSDAELHAKRVFVESQMGCAFAQPEDLSARRMTFSQAGWRHLDLVGQDHAESTDDRDRDRFRGALEPAFGDRLLHTITAEDVAQYRRDRGRAVKASSVNRELALISAIFRTAIDILGFPIENPVHRVRYLDETPAEPTPFTPDEVRLVVEAAGSPARELFITGVFTGLRPGELIHLRWVDVDLEQGILRVTSREGFITKTKRSRNVPVNAEVRRALEATRARQAAIRLEKGGGWDTEYVFPNERTGQPRRSLSKMIRTACERAGVAPRRAYSMRHTFGVRMALANEDMFTLQRLMGHSRVTTTEIYARHRNANYRGKIDDLSIGEGGARWAVAR